VANNQNTFIQLPMDVTNPVELRRFLDKLVQQVDVAFGKRGSGGFALGSSSETSLQAIIEVLNNHETRLDVIESILPGVASDVEDLKNGILIVTTTIDYTADNEIETILCDCTSNVIEITLPDPSIVFNSNRSKTISINKIDTTTSVVNIIPYDSETIAGEASADLVAESEVINLITDGTNWYLGA